MLIPHVKKAWVAALRSKYYSQGRGSLRKAVHDWDPYQECKITGYEYCCLGVLCDIGERKNWENDTYVFPDGKRDDASINMNPAMYALTGLTGDDEAVLVEMNDKGSSFNEIANYIEENL